MGDIVHLAPVEGDFEVVWLRHYKIYLISPQGSTLFERSLLFHREFHVSLVLT